MGRILVGVLVGAYCLLCLLSPPLLWYTWIPLSLLILLVGFVRGLFWVAHRVTGQYRKR